ncbi:hypothetical protein P7K49_029458 [Saguinus oedipus]|uniref:Uncharacterized protein n=1 Tax=Saguinus oedipus TaxID=9490 RepID=A0ABQ9U789_SAGOE|nr:hypothetical protein P7K49_029458 [Saguinus oedipus]
MGDSKEHPGSDYSSTSHMLQPRQAQDLAHPLASSFLATTAECRRLGSGWSWPISWLLPLQPTLSPATMPQVLSRGLLLQLSVITCWAEVTPMETANSEGPSVEMDGKQGSHAGPSLFAGMAALFPQGGADSVHAVLGKQPTPPAHSDLASQDLPHWLNLEMSLTHLQGCCGDGIGGCTGKCGEAQSHCVHATLRREAMKM